MAFVNIENSPISIQLLNESATVPVGETWKVNINYHANGNGAFKINNIEIISSSTENRFKTHQLSTFLIGGDIITSTAATVSVVVGGFVVQKD